MRNKYVFVLVMLLSLLVASFGFTNIYVSNNQNKKEDEFVVVTSFYPMYIAAMNVMEDTQGVTLKNLSEPQTGCLHDFQLTPGDMKLLSTADVFIINGGGVESFMEEVAAQYPDLVIIEACEGIDLLCEEELHEGDVPEDGHVHEVEEPHSHEVNAHAWMSVELYRKQVANIAAGLGEADAKNHETYLANAKIYDRKLEALQDEQQELKALTSGEGVVMFHCAYDYVAMDFGMNVAFCMDLDEERQVSAGEVAKVLEILKEEQVDYIFAEELYGASMCQLVQKEAEVEVLYLSPLNRGEYDADSYLKGMEENMRLIREAFNR